MSPLGGAQNGLDCLVPATVIGQFGFELLAAIRCEPIETDFAICFGNPPLGSHPSFEKDSLQRGVKTAFLHVQHLGRECMNPLSDCVPMQRAGAKYPQDEQQ